MARPFLLPRQASAFTPALRRAAFSNPADNGNIELIRALNTLAVRDAQSTSASRRTSSVSSVERPNFCALRSTSNIRSQGNFRRPSGTATRETKGLRTFSSSSARMDPDQVAKESTDGINEWKKRAPYKVHDKGDDFKVRYEASCHCGKVKYQLSREEPLDSKLCHCTTCQTQHAAPFQWAAIFHKEDINFTNGHHDLEWYDPTDKSIEHKLPCKVRCSYCHSPIMDEGRNMILLFPSLVHLKTEEDRNNFKPRCHMFYSQRVMDIPDGLPKWTGLNQSSDLIEDSPPELVREMERKKEEERAKKFEKGENK